MTCPVCGFYYPPDPDTGYDGDNICPACVDLGWDEDEDGHIYNETRELDDQFDDYFDGEDV